MVRRFLRTRSRKRVRKVTPGGLKVTHFKREKPKSTSCGRCSVQLSGVPNLQTAELRQLRKTERVPNKPYAGVLCNQCLDELVRYKTRLEVKYSNPDFKLLELQRDLTLEKFLPVGWYANVCAGKLKLEKFVEKVSKEKPAKKEAKEEHAVKVEASKAKKAGSKKK